MSRIYELQDAKNKLQNSVDYYAVRIAAWQSVKRLTKKDGGNFAILSKNFDGARFVSCYGSPYLRVSFKDERGAYNYDDICLNENVYLHFPAADDPDKVAARIDYTISKYQENREKALKGLETIDGQIKSITPLLDSLKTAIKAAEAVGNNYILRDYIKTYLGII